MKTVEERPDGRVWTLPNVISFARLAILLPLFGWLVLNQHTWSAVLVLALLALTDWLDGFLARKLRQVSLLGQRLDPVADRVSILVITSALVIARIVPWGLAAVIVAVDLALLVLALTLFRGSPDLPISRIGKWRTAALLTALPLLLFADAGQWGWLEAIGLGLLYLGTLGHVLAGYGYAAGMLRRRRAQSDEV